MEELLNKVIERGWKPYGIDKDDIEVFEYNKDRKNISIGYMNWVSPSEGDYDWLFMSLRELTSRDSGLWQFVCENGMVKHEVYEDIQSWEHTTAEHSDFWYTSGDNYEFYVIESSLKDESELEDFLLNSIKLD